MSHILNYDNQDFDLNSLFLFGFDPLKHLIALIAKGQKDTLKRINDVENKVSHREKKIEELDTKLKKQENYMAMKFKQLSNSVSAASSLKPEGGVSENTNVVNEVNNIYL